MNTRNRNLFAIISFIVLIAGCSNEPSIKSVTGDKVVISGHPEKFVDAVDMARKECQKNDKVAEYIPDEKAALDVVEFKCVSQEEIAAAEAAAATAAGADAQTQPETGATTDAGAETQPETQTETQTEEVPAQ